MKQCKKVDNGIPLDHERCVRNDGKNWHCKAWRIQGREGYCKRHYYSRKLKKPVIEEPEDVEEIANKNPGDANTREHINFCEGKEVVEVSNNTSEDATNRKPVKEPNICEGQEVEEVVNRTPQDAQRCIRQDGKKWRCRGWRFQGGRYCKNHVRKSKMKPIKEPDFVEGKKVEVRDDDEGFKDAWFTAKVLKINKLKMVVQHDQLMADEKAKDPLKESVDHCFVRPIPPPQSPNQNFQLHEIVDAFHRAGWWKGEVIQILENNRYTVHFPTWKERKKFVADKLRVHLDWVGGRWVKPQKREVHPRRKDVAHMSVMRKRQAIQWLQKEIGEGSSSPKRLMSTEDRTVSMKAREAIHQEKGGSSQNETDIFSRPSSRSSVHNAQNLGDPSDVNTSLTNGAQGSLCKAQRLFLQKCSDSQSREHNKDSAYGDIIDQHCEGIAKQNIGVPETQGSHNFLFESTQGGFSQNDIDIFSRPSTRSSVHNAQNLGDPSDVNTRLTNGAQSSLYKAQRLFLRKCSSSQSREHNKDKVYVDIIDQHCEGIEKQIISVSETQGYHNFQFESTLEDPQEETFAREVPHVIKPKCPLEGTPIQTDMPHSVYAFSLPRNPKSRDVNATESKNRKRKLKRSKGRPSKKPHRDEATGDSLLNHNRTVPDITATKLDSFTILEGQEALLQPDSSDIFLTPPESLSDVDSGFSHGAQDDEINQQERWVRTTRHSDPKLLESSADDFIYKTPCREGVALRALCPRKGSEIETFNTIEDVLPLSVLPTESSPPATSGDLPYNQVATQSNMATSWAGTSSNGEVISEDGKLLFRKSYYVWQSFETSEIFRSIPQSPHFRPLAELPERLREKQAVGYMVSYADLVERTRRIQLDESDSSISEKLEALEELEAVGFDVRVIRDRLEKLQRIKGVIVELVAMMKEVESKIIIEKLEQESQKLVADEAGKKFSEIQESIFKMKKAQLMLKLEKLEKESNVFKFQKTLQNVEERKHQLNLDFDRVAAAPW